jgi:hypothetical protein
MSRWRQVRSVGRAVVALGLLCALAGTSRAELRIEGDEAALRVIADQAPIGDVLAALRAKFRLRYRSIDSDRQVSGTISGTLHRVVVRLLDGHDFVVQRSPDGVEILQIAPRGGAKALRQGRAVAPVWRTSLKQISTQTPR